MTTKFADKYLVNLAAGDNRRQKAHLTFRGNVKRGRHGWLRLTPAYSLHVVNEILEGTQPDELVLDPFSGTATTTLASLTRGIRAHSVDVNPFLVWLGNLKVRQFPANTSEELPTIGRRIAKLVKRSAKPRWTPGLHQIEKWWSDATLHLLADLFARIRECEASARTVDLLKIAFCKVMISTSNASFGHQSMSFKKPKRIAQSQRTLFADSETTDDQADIARLFVESVDEIAEGLTSETPLVDGQVFLEDVPEIVEEVGGSSVGGYVPRWVFKSRTEEPPWDDSTGQEMDGARHRELVVRGRLLVERLGGATQ